MSLDRVSAYVKEKGFDAAKKTGTWKDYTVYTAFFEDKDGKSIPTGLPILVLEKNGTLKWVTGIKFFIRQGSLKNVMHNMIRIRAGKANVVRLGHNKERTSIKRYIRKRL